MSSLAQKHSHSLGSGTSKGLVESAAASCRSGSGLVCLLPGLGGSSSKLTSCPAPSLPTFTAVSAAESMRISQLRLRDPHAGLQYPAVLNKRLRLEQANFDRQRSRFHSANAEAKGCLFPLLNLILVLLLLLLLFVLLLHCRLSIFLCLLLLLVLLVLLFLYCFFAPSSHPRHPSEFSSPSPSPSSCSRSSTSFPELRNNT